LSPTGRTRHLPQGDGDKKADRRGEHGISRKTIACGNAGVFPVARCEYSCAYSLPHAHTRLRVHRAPGIPHALYLKRADDLRKPRAHRAARMRRCVSGIGGSALLLVMRGLDPRIHRKRISCLGLMDCRVKPGNDVWIGQRQQRLVQPLSAAVFSAAKSGRDRGPATAAASALPPYARWGAQ
jgi:hypothetical protein